MHYLPLIINVLIHDLSSLPFALVLTLALALPSFQTSPISSLLYSHTCPHLHTLLESFINISSLFCFHTLPSFPPASVVLPEKFSACRRFAWHATNQTPAWVRTCGRRNRGRTDTSSSGAIHRAVTNPEPRTPVQGTDTSGRIWTTNPEPRTHVEQGGKLRRTRTLRVLRTLV